MNEQGKVGSDGGAGKRVIVVDWKWCLFWMKYDLHGWEVVGFGEQVVCAPQAGDEPEVDGDILFSFDPKFDAFCVSIEYYIGAETRCFKPSVEVGLAEEIPPDVDSNKFCVWFDCVGKGLR